MAKLDIGDKLKIEQWEDCSVWKWCQNKHGALREAVEFEAAKYLETRKDDTKGIEEGKVFWREIAGKDYEQVAWAKHIREEAVRVWRKG